LAEDFPAQLAWFRQGSVLAGYRLEAQVGAGGMAVVFQARDERLDRSVALKILAPALASDEAFRRRFIAESRAAAKVDDPHIIPVYEAGEADGVLFIAMRFVVGGDLRRVLNQEGPLSPDRAAEFISPVASALDAAHAAGLVHRDVKPANILVDARPDRPDHVYLSDFGVSKGAASSVSLTGHFLGTPDYSAPEQIQGRVVDGRTDQYALACVAYQLLTGSVPFERDQGMAVLLAHLSEPPPSLGSRRPDLRAAADEVLARALAKAPEERYGSCGDFANAWREALGLTPYLRRSAATPDHPLTVITTPPAFPEPITDRSGKAALPADPAAAATIDSVPAGGSPGAADLPAAAAIVIGPADPGAHPEAVPTTTPDGTEEDVPMEAATATIASVPHVHAAHQRPPSTSESRGGVPPTRRRGRLPAIALAAAVVIAAAIVVPLLASSHNPPSSPGSQKSPSSVSPPRNTAAGKLAATLTDPGTAGVNSGSFNPLSFSPNSLAFSPNGATLAAADGNIFLWDVASGKLTATLNGGGSAVAFSPSGATLATNYGLWNAATRKMTATLANADELGFDSVAFSQSGARLATVDSAGDICLWNAATGQLTYTRTDSRGSVAAVAFSPNGATLATADATGDTFLWDAATGQLTATLTDPSGAVGVTAVAFSPNGAILVTADTDGNAYLWDAATGKLLATLADPVGPIAAVAFSPSGATLATADATGNGSTYLWNVATRKLAATLTAPGAVGAVSVAFSPSGATLATADSVGKIYLWNVG
jgi:serine/threonine protein kinase